MLAGIGRTAMGDAAHVNGIAQQVVQGTPTIACPAPGVAAAGCPDLADNSASLEVSLKSSNSPQLFIPPEQILDRIRIGSVDEEFPALHSVPQRQVATHP